MRDQNQNDWIHAFLDGEKSAAESPHPGTPEAQLLVRYTKALKLLAQSRKTAPHDFADSVIASLPETPSPSLIEKLRDLWPGSRRWIIPALAGALATLVFALGIGFFQKTAMMNIVAVTFEVRAPGAHRVELVGSFNNWKPGVIVLKGPDAIGKWKATVELPTGRHEYMFLVDGKELVTDPNAKAYRPDGFGRKNALIQL